MRISRLKILGVIIVIFIISISLFYLKKSKSIDEGWRAYVNEEYGFKLDYPSDWAVEEKSEENPESPVLKTFHFDVGRTHTNLPGNSGQVSVLYWECENNNSCFNQQILLITGMKDRQGNIEKVKKNGLKGLKGFWFSSGEVTKSIDTREVYMAKENKGIYIIIGTAQDSSNSNYQYIEKVKKIISSLKFVN